MGGLGACPTLSFATSSSYWWRMASPPASDRIGRLSVSGPVLGGEREMFRDDQRKHRLEVVFRFPDDRFRLLT